VHEVDVKLVARRAEKVLKSRFEESVKAVIYILNWVRVNSYIVYKYGFCKFLVSLNTRIYIV
jgi:hypothetical protein